jgi:hypothetical protein
MARKKMDNSNSMDLLAHLFASTKRTRVEKKRSKSLDYDKKLFVNPYTGMIQSTSPPQVMLTPPAPIIYSPQFPQFLQQWQQQLLLPRSEPTTHNVNHFPHTQGTSPTALNEQVRYVSTPLDSNQNLNSPNAGTIRGETYITVTKHICAGCGRFRSMKYHHENPIRPGEVPPAAFCRKCQRESTSTENDSPAIIKKIKKKRDGKRKKVRYSSCIF